MSFINGEIGFPNSWWDLDAVCSQPLSLFGIPSKMVVSSYHLF